MWKRDEDGGDKGDFIECWEVKGGVERRKREKREREKERERKEGKRKRKRGKGKKGKGNKNGGMKERSRVPFIPPT